MSISELLKEGAEKKQTYFAGGVAVGIVTDINDPENLGRMKVKLISRDTSEYETDYIRAVTFMSGNQWGAYFMPQVGDEVLVAFAEGDLNRPYVIGALWNKTNQPPEKIQEGKNDIRKIKTRSGHELIFNDEKEKEFIEVKTPKALTLRLEDEKQLITLKDKDGKNIMQIDSQNGIVKIEAEKKISVHTGNASMEMDGSANQVTIESNQSLSLKSQQISIEAKGGVNIKASSNMTIKADGPLNLKGAMVKIN